MSNTETRPQTEEALTVQLGNTIGKSVVEQMEQIQWDESRNPVLDAIRAGKVGPPDAPAPVEKEAPASGQPAQPTGIPPTKLETPPPNPVIPDNIDWDSLKTADGLYLGKYKTRQEMVKGAAHVVKMAKDALTENERLRSELVRRSATPATAPEPPKIQTEEADAELAAVLAKYEDDVLDVEGRKIVMQAISKHATAVAQATVQAQLATQTSQTSAQEERWRRVDQYMFSKYPESQKFTDELTNYIKTNPVIQKGVQALINEDQHETALEYAWKEFTATHGLGAAPTPENIKKEEELMAADQVRREVVETARRDAGVIPSSAGAGVHEAPEPAVSREQYERAVELARRGYGEELRAIQFGHLLKHSIFGDE